MTLALVEPLIAIASSYRLQALLPPTADPMQGPDTLLPSSSVMLRKALSIIDQQPQPDPLQRARVLVELGDLYLVWGKSNSSAEAYADAWRTLSGNAGLCGAAGRVLCRARYACTGRRPRRYIRRLQPNCPRASSLSQVMWW